MAAMSEVLARPESTLSPLARCAAIKPGLARAPSGSSDPRQQACQHECRMLCEDTTAAEPSSLMEVPCSQEADAGLTTQCSNPAANALAPCMTAHSAAAAHASLPGVLSASTSCVSPSSTSADNGSASVTSCNAATGPANQHAAACEHQPHADPACTAPAAASSTCARGRVKHKKGMKHASSCPFLHAAPAVPPPHPPAVPLSGCCPCTDVPEGQLPPPPPRPNNAVPGTQVPGAGVDTEMLSPDDDARSGPARPQESDSARWPPIHGAPPSAPLVAASSLLGAYMCSVLKSQHGALDGGGEQLLHIAPSHATWSDRTSFLCERRDMPHGAHAAAGQLPATTVSAAGLLPAAGELGSWLDESSMQWAASAHLRAPALSTAHYGHGHSADLRHSADSVCAASRSDWHDQHQPCSVRTSAGNTNVERQAEHGQGWPRAGAVRSGHRHSLDLGSRTWDETAWHGGRRTHVSHHWPASRRLEMARGDSQACHQVHNHREASSYHSECAATGARQSHAFARRHWDLSDVHDCLHTHAVPVKHRHGHWRCRPVQHVKPDGADPIRR